MIIENWSECKIISDTQECNDQKFFITPLPFFEYSFPFLLCTGYESINIINVNTYKMQTLIKAPCKTIKSQQAIFFEQTKDQFKMHFSTQITTDYGSTLYNWYCMEFKEDFKDYLEQEQKLPISSLEE